MQRKKAIIYVGILVIGIILAKIPYSAIYTNTISMLAPASIVVAEPTERELFRDSLLTFADYLDIDYFEHIKTSDDLFITLNNFVKIVVFKESLAPNIKAQFKKLAKDIESEIVGDSETGVELTPDDIVKIQKMIRNFAGAL